jgi:anhydro-N-acetylmuramic acid kinase
VLVIGLMSGTSLDGIDAALVELDGGVDQLSWRLRGFIELPYSVEQRHAIHDGIVNGGAASLCRLHADLGEWFADAVLRLCRGHDVALDAVTVIGSHGQTIWHAVREDGSVAGTLQVGDAAIIAERTGITTVSDLRSRDVAAGGQGAPLVAYLDWLLLRDGERWRALQNLGGIGNVCLLPPLAEAEALPLAFDTGPANVLIDGLVSMLTDGRASFDEDGLMAARGRVDEAWLGDLLRHPYFERRPPKTTGRELFGPGMAGDLLAEGRRRGLRDDDIVATATALSADSIADQYRRFLPVAPAEVIVSGGGARNPVLLSRLAAVLPAGTRLVQLDALGIPGHQKEALAMAILAHETWHGRTATLPALTGARRAVVLGSITPGAPRA